MLKKPGTHLAACGGGRLALIPGDVLPPGPLCASQARCRFFRYGFQGGATLPAVSMDSVRGMAHSPEVRGPETHLLAGPRRRAG